MPFARSPIYFFTACTAKRRPVLASEKCSTCLRAIWEKSPEMDGWFVGRFMLMPDHVHFFASPSADAKNRADWIKLRKSVSARRLVAELGCSPPFWQPDAFDHVLRSAESYGEKWNYVRENPVRAGLVANADAWQWQGEIHALGFGDD